MPRGKTLWEMLVEKLTGPLELKYYNPLKAKVGSAVTIDDIDLRELNFFVREIREYRRSISGRKFAFVDYVLLARPLGGSDVLVRLRLNPIANPSAAGVTHDALLLRLDDEMPYDEGLHNVVRDTTKKFEVHQEGQLAEEFWRINDVQEPYHATVSILRDTDNDGQAEKDEVEVVHLDYWDYWREIADAAGQPTNEFLFVEMNTDNGWFQLWRGQLIDPQKVMIF